MPSRLTGSNLTIGDVSIRLRILPILLPSPRISPNYIAATPHRADRSDNFCIIGGFQVIFGLSVSFDANLGITVQGGQ